MKHVAIERCKIISMHLMSLHAQIVECQSVNDQILKDQKALLESLKDNLSEIDKEYPKNA